MPTTLLIKQFEENIWKHYPDFPNVITDSTYGFIISKFYIKENNNFGKFQIIEEGGSPRNPYDIANISVQPFGGAIESNFASDVELFQRLKQLTYTGFDFSSEINPMYQLKSNISQDVETDKTSIVKYPSVKAIVDWILANTAIIGFWTKTGDDIENNNVGLVKVKKGFRVNTGATNNVGISVTAVTSQTADLFQAINETEVVQLRITSSGAIDSIQPINGSVFANRNNFTFARFEVPDTGAKVVRNNAIAGVTLTVEDQHASNTADTLEISTNIGGTQAVRAAFEKSGKLRIPDGTDADHAATVGQLDAAIMGSGFVPYTGATTDVNLGSFNLISNRVTAGAVQVGNTSETGFNLFSEVEGNINNARRRLASNTSTHSVGQNHQRSRGTLSAKTAVLSGDRCAVYSFGFWDGTVFSNTSRWIVSANENHSSTNKGTKLVIETTKLGTTIDYESLEIAGDKTTVHGTLVVDNAPVNATDAVRKTELDTKQPLDADLTAIAGLSTTSYGRDLLTQADASAVRSYIGAGVDQTAATLPVTNTTFKVLTATNAQAAFNETDAALLKARSTGVITKPVITNLGSGVVRIATGQGEILDNTIPTSETYSAVTWAQTDLDLSALGTAICYIKVNSSGTVSFTTTAPTSGTRRTDIYLYRVSVVSGLYSASTCIATPLQQYGQGISDVFEALGLTKSGLILTANSTNLTIAVSSGLIWQSGANLETSTISPNKIEYAVKAPLTFRLFTQNNTQGSDVTSLDVTHYDLGGTVTLIPGSTSRAQIFTVLQFPSINGEIRIAYGQSFYTSISAAQTALSSGLYNPIIPSAKSGAIVLGYIIAAANATNLADGVQVFVNTNRFGLLGGAVSSTGSTPLLAANNLSDLTSVPTALTNLGVTSLGTTTPATGITTFLSTPSSANLATALTDESGSGVILLGTTGGASTDARLGDGSLLARSTFVRNQTIGNDNSSSAVIIANTTQTSNAIWQLQNQMLNMTAYVAKTATYTATATDSFIDCTSGTFTVTLPTAVGIAGKKYTVKNSGAGTITIATTSSQTIDGVTTKILSVQYSNFQMISDGANWKIISAL